MYCTNMLGEYTIAESTIGPVGILYTGSDDTGVPQVGTAGFGDHVSMIGNQSKVITSNVNITVA